MTALEKLAEQKERSQILLKQLKIQQGTTETPDRKLKTDDFAYKMGEVQSLYQQLMVPNEAPIDSITRRFQKLRLVCDPDQEGTQKTFFRPQRAHRNLTDSDTCTVLELEACKAADNALRFKNNLDS